MAKLRVEGTDLVLSLTTTEKIAGLHGDLRVPLRQVTSIETLPDALAAVRGVRAPGLAIPGRTKIGTWRGRGARRFVVARRGEPGLRIRLKGARYDELLVATPDGELVARKIREGASRA